MKKTVDKIPFYRLGWNKYYFCNYVHICIRHELYCYVLPGLCASGLILPHPVMYKPTTNFSFFHSFPFCTCSETHSFIHRFFINLYIVSCCYI
jgi:hypothetical protein